MSVYKQEATLDEMKQEAIRRMELLGLDEQLTQQFAQDGTVCLSQRLGEEVLLLSADAAAMERVKRFEAEYGCLVYHILQEDNPLAGECWGLLFVSPAASTWEGEREYLESASLVYAYLKTEIEDGICEIMVAPQGGGVVLLA